MGISWFRTLKGGWSQSEKLEPSLEWCGGASTPQPYPHTHTYSISEQFAHP